MDILLIIHEITGCFHHCYWNERNCLSHGLRRYYDPSDCVKDVCCLSQGCFHPGANALLFHIVGIMLSVTIIRWSCHKRISAVLADISLYPEYSSILQLPDTCAVPHNVSGIVLRARWIHLAYEILISEVKIHHWYVIDHEYGGKCLVVRSHQGMLISS